MKGQKKIISIAGIALAVLSGLLLLSYGNSKNHPTINGFIVKSFVSINNKGNLSMDKFRNYIFNLEKPKLKGDWITEPGLFNPSQIDNFAGDQLSNANAVGINQTYTEEAREATPREWIEHGGFSADEPEVPASLRHFYDPTQKPGNRYLRDTVNSKVMSWFQSQFKGTYSSGCRYDDFIFNQYDWRYFETTTWAGMNTFRLPRGNSFKGLAPNGDPLCSIEGEMNNEKIIWMKVKYHRLIEGARERWFEFELKDIPKDRDYSSGYRLEGWDFDNEKPNQQFPNSLINVKDKIHFIIPDKTVELEKVHYDESEARTKEHLMTRAGVLYHRPGVSVWINNY